MRCGNGLYLVKSGKLVFTFGLCQGKVVIGETGQVIGDIVAVNAEVVGRITGNVMVAEMLVLKATSSLEGDIQARRLAIEPGAVLNGKCTMLQQLDDGGDA